MFDAIPAQFNEGHLLCPACGSLYLHHNTVKVFSRKDDAETTRVVAVSSEGIADHTLRSDGCGNPSLRREGVTVSFWCEECPDGQTFELALAQHKGNTLLGWRKLKG